MGGLKHLSKLPDGNLEYGNVILAKGSARSICFPWAVLGFCQNKQNWERSYPTISYQKKKKSRKKNIFFTLSKNILNSCPKCNEFPTLWNHFIFSLFLAKSLLETFLLFGLLALTLRYFSLQDFSFFYIKCIFGDLLWFPWIKTEEQDD